MDEEDILDMVMGKTVGKGERLGKPMPGKKKEYGEKSASNVRPREFNTIETKKFGGEKQKTAKLTGAKSSLHGLNKAEKAQRDTYAEDAIAQKKAGESKRKYKDIEADPTTDTKDVWNVIQQMGPDGEDFYNLSGEEAFDTLGVKSDPELADFWDSLNSESRYYLIKAMTDGSLVTTGDDVEERMPQQLEGMEEDNEVKKQILDMMGG